MQVNLSDFLKTLSRPERLPVPKINSDEKPLLSLVNNDNHPQLSYKDLMQLVECEVTLAEAVGRIASVHQKLGFYEIDIQPLLTSAHLVNSIRFLIEETITHPKNKKAYAYLESEGK